MQPTDPSPRAVPRLAPGLRVVRRGLHHLQVGLYDGHRALLPRTEHVERVLDLLLQGRVVATDPAFTSILEHLRQRGCLAREQDVAHHRRNVAVLGRLDVAGLPDPAELLAAAGIDTVGTAREADVVIVLSAGELDRERLDPLVRGLTSHVVVRLVDGGAVIGPFVVPGTTPCLRCIDAHQGVQDPDHVAVTARYVRVTAHARPDGVADLDPALCAVAVMWAVRDVVAHLRGVEPSTWSRTLHLAPEPSVRGEQEWSRHPRCGCCWSPDARTSGKMGT